VWREGALSGSARLGCPGGLVGRGSHHWSRLGRAVVAQLCRGVDLSSFRSPLLRFIAVDLRSTRKAPTSKRERSGPGGSAQRKRNRGRDQERTVQPPEGALTHPNGVRATQGGLRSSKRRAHIEERAEWTRRVRAAEKESWARPGAYRAASRRSPHSPQRGEGDAGRTALIKSPRPHRRESGVDPEGPRSGKGIVGASRSAPCSLPKEPSLTPQG